MLDSSENEGKAEAGPVSAGGNEGGPAGWDGMGWDRWVRVAMKLRGTKRVGRWGLCLVLVSRGSLSIN